MFAITQWWIVNSLNKIQFQKQNNHYFQTYFTNQHWCQALRSQFFVHAKKIDFDRGKRTIESKHNTHQQHNNNTTTQQRTCHRRATPTEWRWWSRRVCSWPSPARQCETLCDSRAASMPCEHAVSGCMLLWVSLTSARIQFDSKSETRRRRPLRNTLPTNQRFPLSAHMVCTRNDTETRS